MFGLDLGDMGSQAGARVVPNRNAMLLSAAANAAVAMGGTRIVIGCNAADQRDYRDCRPEFLDRMAAALDIGVDAPLLELSKAEVVAQAIELGLRRSDAWACYTAGPKPCGVCPSCVQADEAWGG